MFLAEELTTRLFKTKKFQVVERRLLNKVLEEQSLSVSDLIDKESIKKIGNLLGVTAIVTGSITNLGDDMKINARIISTETGSIATVASESIGNIKMNDENF